MSDEPRIYRTKTGRVLTDADMQELADEAERGYDADHLVKKPGRPRMGSAPAVVVPARLHAEIHGAVKALAEAEQTSVSELVRTALRVRLDGGDTDPPGGVAHPRTGRHGPTPAETTWCRLKEAGWEDDQIVERYRITDGRVISVVTKHRRGTPLRADYVLETATSSPKLSGRCSRMQTSFGRSGRAASAARTSSTRSSPPRHRRGRPRRTHRHGRRRPALTSLCTSPGTKRWHAGRAGTTGAA